jgi:hypothetical protein
LNEQKLTLVLAQIVRDHARIFGLSPKEEIRLCQALGISTIEGNRDKAIAKLEEFIRRNQNEIERT